MQRRSALALLAALLPATLLKAGAPLSARHGASARSRATPLMGEMTSPQFRDAARVADLVLIPVGAIEAHGPHLPLASDAICALAQLRAVQAQLARDGVEALIGPALNIGLTADHDGVRDGTAIYPGSLTISTATFISLYAELLVSLHQQGLNNLFLYSGHLSGTQLDALISAAERANRTSGLRAFALIDSERLARLSQSSSPAACTIREGLNFPMLTRLFGAGDEPSFTTHADGWETSLMLHFRPDLVRPGYERLPHATSSAFLKAGESGDASLNPRAMGGFPTAHATAEKGREIADYRTARICEAIRRSLS